MAQRRHCSVCGRRAAEETLQKSGGLCWRCAHPGVLATCMLVVAAISAVVLVVILKYAR